MGRARALPAAPRMRTIPPTPHAPTHHHHFIPSCLLFALPPLPGRPAAQEIACPAPQHLSLPHALPALPARPRCPQLYNEGVRDLLSRATRQQLELRESPDRGVHVRGLKEFVVKSAQEMRAVLEVGVFGGGGGGGALSGRTKVRAELRAW